MSRLLHAHVARRLCDARDVIHADFAEALPIAMLAKQAGMSPYHFVRTFRHVFGKTPHQYLTGVRIDAAKNLLSGGDVSVTEACFEVGFASLGSFSSLFRRQVGRSPSAYQREVRAILQSPGIPRLTPIPMCFFTHFAQTAISEKPGAGAR